MGQKDPLTEWQREGFEMFGSLMKGVAQDFVKYVMHVQVVNNDAAAPIVQNIQESSSQTETQGGFAGLLTSDDEVAQAPPTPIQKTVVNSPNDWTKTPRNALCPCGSGKKYKMCHGRA